MNKCSHLNKSSRRRFEVEWGGRNESAWTFECPQGLYQSLLCSSPWPCGIRTDTVPTLLLGAVPCPDHNPGKSPNWSWSLALWGPHSCPGLPTRPFPMVWRMGRKKGIVGREGEVKRPWGRLHKLNPIFKTVYVTPNHQSIYVFWAAGCGLGKAVTKLPVWCWELQATQSSEFSSVHRSEQMLGWWGSRLEHVGGGTTFSVWSKVMSSVYSKFACGYRNRYFKRQSKLTLPKPWSQGIAKTHHIKILNRKFSFSSNLWDWCHGIPSAHTGTGTAPAYVLSNPSTNRIEAFVLTLEGLLQRPHVLPCGPRVASRFVQSHRWQTDIRPDLLHPPIKISLHDCGSSVKV